MSRKVLWLVIAGLLVGSTLLASCQPETIVETVTVEVTVPGGGTETIVVTATPAPPEPVTFESEDPTTLYDIVGAGDTDTLDPAWNYESAGDAIILNVYEQLVTYDGANATEFVPALAEDWDISADGLTYVFYIREGVTFHDGAELTPSDVAYSLRRGILQGGSWSPQWLYTEAFFGTGVYDIAEIVGEIAGEEDVYIWEDDPEGLQGAPADALQAACEEVMEMISYDDAAGTVTFQLSQPWAPMISTLAQSWGSILDEDWAVAQGAWDGDCATWQNYYGITSETTPLRAVMNGTGPYMFDHWTPGEETVLVRNPNYWRDVQGVPVFEGGPTGATIDRVVIRLVGEWGTRFAMLQAGDADLVYVPRENITQVDPMVGEWCEWDVTAADFSCEIIDEEAPLRLYVGQPTVSRTDAFFIFDINVEGGNPYVGSGELDGNGIPPDFFTDVHVRRAFNYCFDWEAFIADALAGEGVQNVGYLIPGMLGYEPDGPHYTYDPDMCAEELQLAWDGAVWENGFRFQIGYNTGNVTRQTVAQILQANLADIDPKFNVEIIGLPWPSFLAAIRASTLPLYISGWIEDIHDPHNWAQPFMVGTYASRQRLPDDMRAEFQELVNAGVAATTPEERAEIYHELTALDYEYAPAIRLAVATGRTYMPRWINGYYYNPIYGQGSRYFTLTKD
ncbi:MAG: ABC transporter substrate-binding protein [Anaerolineae bacterium]|nr:ABC transporter substrate-binding protein [Anaerolineae bacterium]